VKSELPIIQKFTRMANKDFAVRKEPGEQK
jgi:hypothetical protein